MLRAIKPKPIKHRSPHGMSSTPEYSAWVRKRAKLVLCEEWENNFLAFYFHVGHRPSNKHRLGRINPSGYWEPGNVEWATPERISSRKGVLVQAYAAYKSRSTHQYPVVHRLSCAGPKCGIEFFSVNKHKRYCSVKCSSANSYFVRQFK